MKNLKKIGAASALALILGTEATFAMDGAREGLSESGRADPEQNLVNYKRRNNNDRDQAQDEMWKKINSTQTLKELEYCHRTVQSHYPSLEPYVYARQIALITTVEEAVKTIQSIKTGFSSTDAAYENLLKEAKKQTTKVICHLPKNDLAENTIVRLLNECDFSCGELKEAFVRRPQVVKFIMEMEKTVQEK